MTKSNIYLGIISTILISIGSITAITDLNSPFIGLAIIMCGSVGLGIREWLKPKQEPKPNP